MLLIRVSFFLLFGLLGSFWSFGQSEKDSTNQKIEYQEIISQIKSAENQTQRVLHIQKLIEKGKKEENVFRICQGFHILSSLYNDAKKLQYADSIIAYSKDEQTENYPTLAYKIKGDYFYTKNIYKKALDNYLKFSLYAKKHENKSLIFNSDYYIAITKRRTGDLMGALEMYYQNFEYAKNNKKELDPTSYLNSITAMTNLYNDLRQVDSAMYYSRYGMKEAMQMNQKKFIAHFSLTQGVAHHFSGDHFIAIDSIENQISYFEEVRNRENLQFAYYYLGEAYNEVGYQEKAIFYFKKLDTIFLNTRAIFPTLRDAYVRLRNYYKEQQDSKNEIIYLDRLIEVDSISTANNIYLKKEIIEDYDIPDLKAQKEQVSRKLNQQKKSYTIIVVSLISLVVLLFTGFIIQYRKRKTYKKRFQEIVGKKDSNAPKKEANASKKELNIPKDIVESILEGLDRFEKETLFTSNEITLNHLAKDLLTNPNYLSKVVNHYKELSFSNYLNNLRIEYAIDQLKNNELYKKYTIKAIAFEVGFNNVQSFTKAFHKSKGINPSYFIKELRKTNS